NLLHGPLWNHIDWIKREYRKLRWNRICDLLEFIASALEFDEKANFINECNRVLKYENSGYRFVGDVIAPITDREQISEIEKALNSFQVARSHIENAVELFSKRPDPDYPNTIKESISAVEALCKKIVRSEITLGQALEIIEKRRQYHYIHN
ncbi:MAG TPA: hypothetical protein VE130_08520, partial [Nitrososphaeraceae archaeon]|nr:hypothetical protein [Nitrososphaeraceae archaeon]